MKLHTWQQPNVDRVTRLLGTGSRCVADTSGTGAGKTPMALFACRNASLRPTIICPLAVVPSWRETLGKLGIEGDVMHYEGLLAQARKDNSPLGKWVKKPLPAKEGVRKRRRQGTWGWTLDQRAQSEAIRFAFAQGFEMAQRAMQKDLDFAKGEAPAR